MPARDRAKLLRTRLPPPTSTSCAQVHLALADPTHASSDLRVRVSLAALIRLQRRGKYLLVRNLRRPEFFAPLGGVYKFKESAIPLLADFGFCPEGYSTAYPRAALDADSNTPDLVVIQVYNVTCGGSWLRST